MDLDLEADQKHPNVIIHIDIDHFYSQVEEILDPKLKDVPVGIKQRFHVVTCNYLARDFGVTKMMLINEAMKKCPNLVLVNGEDLAKYRNFSNKLFELMQKFTDKVEKLGLDENYLDVTSIIEKRFEEMENNVCDSLIFQGFIHPNEEAFDSCSCGCKERLILGTHLAKEIKEQIFKEIGLTSCAGVAHNKLLAKLIGSQNKPNKQTVLAPTYASQFLSELKSLKTITGIGEKTAATIEETGIKTIAELQSCDMEKLVKKIGYDLAVRTKELSMGKDNSIVKMTGKPKSLGIEDSCKAISVRSDVEDKFKILLVRLVQLVRNDDRIPICIKVKVRKYDPIRKNSHRETRQCNILPSLFKIEEGKVNLVDGGEQKLMKTVMTLFERVIDLKLPFNITLLGLSFSKFQERNTANGSITSFLMKKKDVEVQAITNLSNESSSFSSDSFRTKTASPLGMDYETMSNHSLASLSGSESEIEPSPKKKKLNILLARRRAFSSHSNEDIASPSKLRVSELRLSSNETSFFANATKSSTPLSMISKKLSPLSISAKKTEDSNSDSSNVSGESSMETSAAIPLRNPMKSFLASKFPTEKFSNSFFTTKTASSAIVPSKFQASSSTPNISTIVTPISSTSKKSHTFVPISEPPECPEFTQIPPTVDLNVFKDLPIELQRELLVAWKNNPSNSAQETTTSPSTASTSAVISSTNNAKKAKIMNSKSTSTSNTLHKYFVKN